MLTNEKLRELLEMEGKATPGPWEWNYGEDEGQCLLSLAHTVIDGSDHDGEPGATDDRNFITQSRNVFRELVLEVLRLREQIRSGTRLEKGREGA